MDADADVNDTDEDDDDDDDDDDNEAGACEWSEWSEWTECTVTCGRGFIIRHRTAQGPNFKSVCGKPFTVQQRPCPSSTAACTLRQYSSSISTLSLSLAL